MGAEVYGIGAIALALVGLITKIWTDSTKSNERSSQVIEKNATVMTELKDAVHANTQATQANTDHLTKLVLKIIKTGK